MATLTSTKNSLNFDPVKVTKFEELEREKTALVKDMTQSENSKENLQTLLEVRYSRLPFHTSELY